ncbi:hypothetical protein INR49_023168 [Caranx melampygus]|nr:hypothetical protein INR49_023168 [Caranx melampygus]
MENKEGYTKMKTATNIYIFNLALADSLFLATLPFQGTDVFLGFWPFGNALCKAVVSIDYYNMFTSTFTLTVMSMDRYVAVCHPVKALDMRTPHKAKEDEDGLVSMGVVWMVVWGGLRADLLQGVDWPRLRATSFSVRGKMGMTCIKLLRVTSPELEQVCQLVCSENTRSPVSLRPRSLLPHLHLHLWHLMQSTPILICPHLSTPILTRPPVRVTVSVPIHPHDEEEEEEEEEEEDGWNDKINLSETGVECIVVLPEPRSHWDPVFGTCVFLFSFLIPVAIISICYSLMVKRLRSVRILSGSKEKDRNLRRITRMVLVVVAAFVVCWTPIQIMVLAQSLGFNLSSLFILVLMHFCIALGYVNSSLNPVLYAFLDENFKRCFREFCHPSPFRLDTQQSGRMRSIAREVAVAYSCKAGDDGGPGGGTPNPA